MSPRTRRFVFAAALVTAILIYPVWQRNPLAINISSVSAKSTHDSVLLDEHRRQLQHPLLSPSAESLGTKNYIIGTHHAVDADYPSDYEWIDTASRRPFTQVIQKNGLNNNAMGRMPAGSRYDALVIGRGWNNEYMDERETVPLWNLSIVG